MLDKTIPIQSSLYIVSNFTSIFCVLILSISGCITIYKLYLSQKTINVSNKTFFKCLFKNFINHPFQSIFCLLGLFIISYAIRTTTFSCLDLDRNYNVCIFLIIIFST